MRLSKSPESAENEAMSGDERNDADFFVQYVRAGVVMGLLATSVVFAYLVLTWARPQRLVLAVVDVSFLVFTALIMALPARRLAAHPKKAWFIAIWSVASSVSVTVATLVDGGADSPLVWLYCLPLVHIAAIFPPSGTVPVGASVVAMHLLVAVAGPPVDSGRVLMSSAGLGLLTFLSTEMSNVLWAQYRAQAELGRRLAALADRDGLTGCLNHRAFHQRLHDEVERARRHQHPLALLLIDLDHFKAINDAHGHPAGDAVLTRVATVLHHVARRTDVVGRLGGEEFALLLPATDLSAADAAARRLREQIAALRDPVTVTASIGVSAIPARAHGPLELLEQADVAMYTAKDRGRNRIRVYEPKTAAAVVNVAQPPGVPDSNSVLEQT